MNKDPMGKNRPAAAADAPPEKPPEFIKDSGDGPPGRMLAPG
jgi:hypothetical protein